VPVEVKALLLNAAVVAVVVVDVDSEENPKVLRVKKKILRLSGLPALFSVDSSRMVRLTPSKTSSSTPCLSRKLKSSIRSSTLTI
jgi:hypothetical protein